MRVFLRSVDRARVLMLVLASAAALGGCHWGWDSIGRDGGTAANDVNVGVRPVCPPTMPTNTACGQEFDRMSCSYGDDIALNCRSRVLCLGGQWTPMPGGPCVPCNASTSMPLTGVPCMPLQEVCIDSTQMRCECQAIANGSSSSFVCSPPPAPPCPSDAPNVGTPCNGSDGMQCDYGHCTGGWAITCSGGVWSLDDMTQCP
jgi:hypothetical protein